MQDEVVKLKVLYNNREYEIDEQELDRIVALASKKLRGEIISSRFGFAMPRIRNFSDEVKVMRQGYESSFYNVLKEALVYAIETDMLENYRITRQNITDREIKFQYNQEKNLASSKTRNLNTTPSEVKKPVVSIDAENLPKRFPIKPLSELNLLYFE